MKQQVKISKVKGNPNNPRIIKNDKFKKLVKSIQEFPEMLKLRPIVVDENMIVLGGNMRLKASKDAGLKEVWIEVAEGLTEEQKKEFIVKDNVGFGEWEWDILANEWDSVQLAEWGLDVWENEDDKIAEAGLIEDDEIPEVKESIVKRGDIWQLGEHRVMCGDSTSSDDVAKLMNGEKADMVFTDPPYGVDYKGIKNDDKNGLENLLDLSFSNINTNSKEGASFYCFHSDKNANIFHNVYRKYCHFSSMIIWAKESIVLSQTDYQSKHEPCFYGWLNTGTHKWYNDRKQQSVWFSKRDNVKGHTTPKPIDIVSNALNNSSQKGHLVIDLFLGSGSTLIAAEKLKRKCYGMELDEKYCDVIINRWEQFTGLKAKKV